MGKKEHGWASRRRLAGTKRLSGTERLSGAERLSGTKRLGWTERLSETKRLVGTERLGGTERLSWTKRPGGTEGLSETKRLVGTMRLGCTEGLYQRLRGCISNIMIEPARLEKSLRGRPGRERLIRAIERCCTILPWDINTLQYNIIILSLSLHKFRDIIN